MLSKSNGQGTIISQLQEWCSTCAYCATRESNSPASRAPLGTIRAGYPTQIIVADLVGPLPESKNKNSYIMVVGDYHTRWMEALPIPNQEATTVAEKLVDHRFSVPEQLYTQIRESKLMSEVCKLVGIHLDRLRSCPPNIRLDTVYLNQWCNPHQKVTSNYRNQFYQLQRLVVNQYQ